MENPHHRLAVIDCDIEHVRFDVSAGVKPHTNVLETGIAQETDELAHIGLRDGYASDQNHAQLKVSLLRHRF